MLQHKLQLSTPLPYDPLWSAAPDFLHYLSDYCLQQQPHHIVECSSGTSTLVLARCCQLLGQGRVFSLEHEDEFAARTRNQLDELGLQDYTQVIHAPLQEIVIEQRSYQWYSLQQLSVSDIDLLVIDGPPGFLQKHSRYPALPMLHERFASSCTLFLDDAARADERDIVNMWASMLQPASVESIESERGCVIMQFQKARR